jgi:hypothetical protein
MGRSVPNVFLLTKATGPMMVNLIQPSLRDVHTKKCHPRTKVRGYYRVVPPGRATIALSLRDELVSFSFYFMPGYGGPVWLRLRRVIRFQNPSPPRPEVERLLALPTSARASPRAQQPFPLVSYSNLPRYPVRFLPRAPWQ